MQATVKGRKEKLVNATEGIKLLNVYEILFPKCKYRNSSLESVSTILGILDISNDSFMTK